MRTIKHTGYRRRYSEQVLGTNHFSYRRKEDVIKLKQQKQKLQRQPNMRVSEVHSVDDIPLFPPWCVMRNAETNCTFLGITLPCLPPVTPGPTPFSLGIKEGHIWVFLALTAIGFAILAYAPRPWSRANSMKVIAGLYAAETAWFALFRYFWGLGRPLVIGAALHNLFEWGIVIHLTDSTTTENLAWRMQLAAVFICTVIALVIMIPDLLVAFLTEQTTGILLDFAMPVMFAYKYFNGDAKVKTFYFYPLLAHTAHILFTILPLVFANFHVGEVSWYNSFYLESAIYVSAPLTHIFYGAWAFYFDKVRIDGKAAHDDKAPIIDQDYRIKNVPHFLLAGFLMGLVALVVLPIVLGVCQAPISIKAPFWQRGGPTQ